MPVTGSGWNRAAKDTLAESAQLGLEDAEFKDMIPNYVAAPIAHDNDG